jgi:hypothetical protein
VKKSFGRGAVATAAVAAMALGLAACGGDSGDGGDPAADLKAAADKTTKQNSFHIKGSDKGGPDGDGTFEVSYSKDPKVFDMTFEGEPDEDNPTGKGRMILTADTVYMNGGEPVDGKSWVKISSNDPTADQMGVEEQADQVDQVALSASVLSTAEKIEKVGEEKVAGKEATHYKGTIKTSELAAYKGDAMTAEHRDEYVKEVKNRKLDTFTVEVWLTEDGLIAKTRESGKGAEGQMESVVEFLEYGQKVTAEVPPADQVMDLKEMMDELGELEEQPTS